MVEVILIVVCLAGLAVPACHHTAKWWRSR